MVYERYYTKIHFKKLKSIEILFRIWALVIVEPREFLICDRVLVINLKTQSLFQSSTIFCKCFSNIQFLSHRTPVWLEILRIPMIFWKKDGKYVGVKKFGNFKTKIQEIEESENDLRLLLFVFWEINEILYRFLINTFWGKWWGEI